MIRKHEVADTFATSSWHVARGWPLALLLIASACGVDTTAGQDEQPTAPASPDTASEYTPTPVGLVHTSCVHVLAEGDELQEDGSILRKSGVLEAVEPCGFADPMNRDAASAPSRDAGVAGWQEWAQWNSPADLGEMQVLFHVPAAPSYYTGQTIFLFPAFEGYSATGINIIQPVLQYGGSKAGGGKYWSIASWIGGAAWGNNYYTSADVPVATGNVIEGIIYGDPYNCTSAGCNWSVSAAAIPYGKTTALGLHTTIGWRYAMGGVLETYGVNYCNQYPATYDNFYDIYVAAWPYEQTQYTPTWGHYFRASGCGENITSNPTTVNLYY